MNRFLKLVNFEFNRFWKLFLVLGGITVVFQILGVIFESRKYLDQANELIYKGSMPKNEFLQGYGTMSMGEISMSLWFLGPIGISAVALIMYAFFTWYREWFGKNTFSYRLLMLPTARINIYLAKATSLFVYVFSLVAFQLLLLPLESQVLKWMVPKEFRTDLSIFEITDNVYLTTLYPNSFLEFILYYGAGMTAVLVVFTAILFERSFRMKGIFYGIVYVGLSFLVLITPLLLNEFVLKSYFYPMELFLLEILFGVIVLTCAIWMGHYLIRNKVRV